MQGQQLLFTSVFGKKTERKDNPVKQSDSTAARDKALVYRYYYYIEIKRIRYDDVLIALEKEFFISSCVVIKRLGIENNYDLLKEVLASKPKHQKLKKLYPFFNWQ